MINLFKKFSMLKGTPVTASNSTTLPIMTKQEMDSIGPLLDNLASHLKVRRVAVINNAVHDGYMLTVYDDDGVRNKELDTCWYNVSGCVERLLKRKEELNKMHAVQNFAD